VDLVIFRGLIFNLEIVFQRFFKFLPVHHGMSQEGLDKQVIRFEFFRGMIIFQCRIKVPGLPRTIRDLLYHPGLAAVKQFGFMVKFQRFVIIPDLLVGESRFFIQFGIFLREA
jgi:hypothetical protein